MSIGEHLEDLRRRLIYGLIGVGLACCLTMFYAGDVVAWLVLPLSRALRSMGLPPQVYALRATTSFGVWMKVGLIAGLILGGPWLVYQLWKFVSAGLYAVERRIVLVLAPFSATMTVLGVLFTYYFLLPLALFFLLGFSASYPMVSSDQPIFVERAMTSVPWMQRAMGFFNGTSMVSPEAMPGATQPSEAPATQPAAVVLPRLTQDPVSPVEGQAWIKAPQNELRVYSQGQVRFLAMTSPGLVQPLIELDDYIDLVMFMMLAIAVAFQVPVVMMVLGWTRLVDPLWLTRVRKYVFFACWVVAALLTPTGDPFNLSLVAVPLWLLFELGLLVMRLAYRRRGLANEG